MSNNKVELKQLQRRFQAEYGGNPKDYFGAAYLTSKYGLGAERACQQASIQENRYGIQGFHLEPALKLLYLFSFSPGRSLKPLKSALRSMTGVGIPLVFASERVDSGNWSEEILKLVSVDGPSVPEDRFLRELRSTLRHGDGLIQRVFVQIVFEGDPEEASRSVLLQQLIEDLGRRQYVVQAYFGRPVTIDVEFVSTQLGPGSGPPRPPATQVFHLDLTGEMNTCGPKGEGMMVGLAPVLAFADMYDSMGYRFLDRNVRAALGQNTGPNRAIMEVLGDVAAGKSDPREFAFNHNGVTLYAEEVRRVDGKVELVEPRLLNGAQTVQTIRRFVADQAGKTTGLRESLAQLQVICRIVSKAQGDFVTAVTIANNRQNPIKPWNLRAHDEIQLELEDWFRTELGIYYERQEGSFKTLSDAELDRLGIECAKCMNMVTLAKTFLAVDGHVDLMTSMRPVFETQRLYERVFKKARMRAAAPELVVCYKLERRMRLFLNEILDQGEIKYAYVIKARNLVWSLLCQAFLNDDRRSELAEDYGYDLTLSRDFVSEFANLVSRKVRFVLSDIVGGEPYANFIADQKYGFLNSRRLYRECMAAAEQRYNWARLRLG